MNCDLSPYQIIISAIEQAGFFVSGPNVYEEPECIWNRIITASKRRPQGGYTGNSFWISFDDGDWFIGVWSGRIYKIRIPQDIAPMSIAWLSSRPDGTFDDFDQWLIDDFGLFLINEIEFRPTRIILGPPD